MDLGNVQRDGKYKEVAKYKEMQAIKESELQET